MNEMINKFLKTLVVILLTCTISACNKTKRYSNRIEGNKWKITSIQVNGIADTSHPELLFKDCDIYKETCNGTWISPEGGRAQFVWQFRENGKVLEIANQTDHAHDILDVKAAEKCIEYSGVYEVMKSQRKTFSLKSTKINGHFGKEVKIEMEKKD